MTSAGDQPAPPRPLTARERETLQWMVLHGTADPQPTDEERRAWLVQVPGAMVYRTCGCGACPSIELDPGDPSGPRTVLAGEAEGLGLALFIDDGRLSYLKGFPVEEGVFPVFPPVEELS
ncbi:hypothetical protein GCM10027030_06170 [Luteococcus sediminum]